MFIPLHVALMALGALAADAPPQATAQGPLVDGRAAVSARLVSEHASVAAGVPTRLGLLLTPAPGWHIYGPEQGDVGYPTAVQWTVPGGTVGESVFPEAHPYDEGPHARAKGYGGPTLVMAPWQPPSSLPAPAQVRAHVRFLACRILCTPGELTVALELPVEAEPRAADPQVAAWFAHPPPGDLPDAAPEPPGLTTGPRAVMLALGGGLLLNLMPCVLPVLGLKALGLVQARRSRREKAMHSLGYALGVLGSMAALGATLLGLRAAGYAVGWGFQFQSPGFLAATAVATTAFALHALGLFNVSPLVQGLSMAHHRARGLWRSLLEGVLAVAVATPCSAPLLGSAAAFALTASASWLMLIFLTIGVGLCAPLVLLTWAPQLGRLLPRPGPWMAHLKTAMGLSLLGTSLWLVGLFQAAAGTQAAAALFGLLCLCAAGLWGLGKAEHLMARGHPFALALWLGLTLACATCVPGLLGAPASEPTAVSALAGAGVFSEDAVRTALAEGRPVLVDFTADWCLTCRLNERLVLRHKTVQAALAQHHVAVMVADFSRQDAALLQILLRHGRAGVPMYLLYSPRTPNAPHVLPELLSVSGLVQALEGL